MDKKTKLLLLKTRETNILARGHYYESPGVLKKVRRQIKKLEKQE